MEGRNCAIISSNLRANIVVGGYNFWALEIFAYANCTPQVTITRARDNTGNVSSSAFTAQRKAIQPPYRSQLPGDSERLGKESKWLASQAASDVDEQDASGWLLAE